jgi:hypothetical protein
MILVEPSATNLITYSEDFNTVNGSTKTTGIVAPDGSNNAERFSGGALINNVFANSKTASIATGSAVDYVGSIYVRGTAGETVTVFMKRAGAGPIVSSGSLSVLLTGQWQRVENLSLTTDPANDGLRIFISSSSETADSVDLWGAQVETGSVSTSYIPTSGSTVTRAADNLEITGSAFTDFYNQSEGTVYIETLGRELDFNYVFAISDATTSNRILAIHHNFNHIYIQNSGVLQTALDGGTFTAGTLCRYAASFKENDVRVSIDGGAEVNDTTATLPTTTKLNVGSRETGSENLNGHIKRLIYWPYHSDSL